MNVLIGMLLAVLAVLCACGLWMLAEIRQGIDRHGEQVGLCAGDATLYLAQALKDAAGVTDKIIATALAQGVKEARIQVAGEYAARLTDLEGVVYEGKPRP